MHPATQKLAPADEANLVLDHVGQVNVFLVAGLLGPGGFLAPDGTPDMARLRAVLRERIAELPALRKRAARVGRRHRWIESRPDVEHHVRLVEPVDGLAGLQNRCAELMRQPLAADRPLWEILVVPGATARGPGVVLRIHHAVADGMTAAVIVQQLFDPGEPGEKAGNEPQTHGLAEAPRSRPRDDPRRTLRRLRIGLRRIRKTLWGHAVGGTVLLGERSANHGVAFVRAEIEALESTVRPQGATVNDALLGSVAAGFRAVLIAAGEPVPAWLPVSEPVALRRRGTAGNQVGVMLVRLPLGEPDPDERLRLIAAQTREEKRLARDQGTLEFMRGPIGARIMDRLARRQHLVGGFVTNVPGPEGKFRLAGAPVVALWPVAVLAGNVRFGVAAVSYAGNLCCGIHFDASNVQGDVFAQAMGEELARLGR
ncbi:wax ester/triacylglycerol synthase domain-containing protein [Arthrobacter sp. B10-11]|uniref:wax ester/triacylglycerol synthase domain-containing protein n=1 Tax=Arthrobacter sp. B10-11 TaxID=3081160 RepID=UPI0029551D54|nr:wax ester/triacylglycerol synthase domain-containing protein [Arthrobacter sp. B10-11]MDV8148956.1 WS/DGAT domain-containing protein [Arthrobacter sp. B10-11]